MKIEKLILSVLCAVVCIWVAKMIIGVVGLAYHQGAYNLLALFEVAMFAGAGAIPLVLIWRSPAKRSKWLFIVWTICTVYVVLLAANALRLGLMGVGISRFAIWTIIAILFVRIFTHDDKKD